uniref:helix-turn-helix transcriptional regulator n=1 Tax=Pseudomonas sp. AE27 TaxID=3127460 RepID=UPI00403FAA3F
MQTHNSERLLPPKTVCSLVGISRITLWRWCRDGVFPAGRHIGPRRTAWLESEVNSWINSRPLIGEV